MPTSRTLRWIPSAVLAAAALAAGCHSYESSEEAQIDAAGDAKTFEQQVEAGKVLYTLHCASCHGSHGEGDTAPRLVDLKQGALPLEPPSDRKFRTQRFVTVADVADFASRSMPP